MPSKGTIVIVDAYAPTRRLAPRFKAAGYECVRVQSTAEVPEVYRGSLGFDDYLENIIHTGDFGATLSAVTRFKPVAVVAGGEVGVEFADRLSEAMHLPTNGTALSSARRHKFTMIERLREVGLRATRQCLPATEHELRRWHAALGGRVVVKPSRSAAGDGVHFCDTPDESVAAWSALVGKTNIFSEANSDVVVQEYLQGTEYVVNTVSRDGRHQVTDIWRTTRVAVNAILDMGDSIQILPRQGEVQDALVPYAFQVLDALGILHGPGHLEIKLTPDGPCLVEIGARIAGGDMPYYAELATGQSQLDWTVDAYVDPPRFTARHGTPYPLQQHFASVAMLSPVQGVLTAYPCRADVERLESLLEVREIVKPGTHIRRTVDDTTYPMIVLLRHPIQEVVLRDWLTLRYLDGKAFYEVE